MRKRSVTIDGHRTSVSLEDAFWTELTEIARRRGLSLAALVAEVDHGRTAAPRPGAAPGAAGNLSSALRVYVLEDLQRRTISRD